MQQFDNFEKILKNIVFEKDLSSLSLKILVIAFQSFVELLLSSFTMKTKISMNLCLY